MKTFALICLLISPAVMAGDSLTVTTADHIQGCTVVAQVTASPPYWFPGSDIRQMKTQAIALGADTLVVTHRGALSGSGVAYRCGK